MPTFVENKYYKIEDISDEFFDGKAKAYLQFDSIYDDGTIYPHLFHSKDLKWTSANWGFMDITWWGRRANVKELTWEQMEEEITKYCAMLELIS